MIDRITDGCSSIEIEMDNNYSNDKNYGSVSDDNYGSGSDDETVGPIGRVVIAIVIGVIIGIIIALIVIVLMYYSRTFFFEYCSTEAPYCLMSDYVIDPTTALEWGHKHDELLTIDNGQLNYHPPRANRNCVPQRPPIVVIPYPQYCTFEVEGQEVEFRQSDERKDVYERVDENGVVCSDQKVLAKANCRAISSTNIQVPTRGRVSNRWDLN